MADSLRRFLEPARDSRQRILLGHPRTQALVQLQRGVESLAQRPCSVGTLRQPLSQFIPACHLRWQHDALERGVVVEPQPGELAHDVKRTRGRRLAPVHPEAPQPRFFLRGLRVHGSRGRGQVLSDRAGSHGQIPSRRQRRHRRQHVVTGTVGRQIVDVGHEGSTTLQRLPHRVERAAWHPWMPNDVVRSTLELLMRKAG